MVGAAIHKNFSVIATDSALTTQDKIGYNNPKLFFWGGKYLCTGMGIPAYISKLDFNKFKLEMDGLSMYLEDYFKGTREHVVETLKNMGEEKVDPSLCFFVMGIWKKKPGVMVFNSYLDFKPKYFFPSGDKVKFVPIFVPEEDKIKTKMFGDSLEYMETKLHKFMKKGAELTSGLLAEVLTRGIYKKADTEFELTGKKSTGGAVCAGAVYADGLVQGLTHAIV